LAHEEFDKEELQKLGEQFQPISLLAGKIQGNSGIM
jgi:hypothetical protein